MVSPFFIQPAGEGLGEGLAGLGMILRANKEREEEKQAAAEKEERQRAMMGAMFDAYQTKDPAAFSKLVDEYPEAAQMAMQGMGAIEDWQRQEMARDALAVLSNPENAASTLERRIATGTASGRNMSDSQALLELLNSGDIEGAKREAQAALIFADNDAWKAWNESQPKPGEGFTLSPGQSRFDASGKLLASADPNRETKEDQNGILRYVDDGKPVFPEVETVAANLQNKDRFDQAKVLRGEIATATKDFDEIANAWDRLSSGANDPSPAGDVALIFNYMKMLDPGSTVREGEFATAQQTTGIPGYIRNLYNQSINGERLSPSQRADFFNQAENIFESSEQRRTNLEDAFVRLGERAGLARADLVIDRGAAPSVQVGPKEGDIQDGYRFKGGDPADPNAWEKLNG